MTERQFLEGSLNYFDRNVRIPSRDKLYRTFDWIRSSCLFESGSNTMALIEGGVGSPDIVLHLGRGTMKPAVTHPIRETSRSWLNFFATCLKEISKVLGTIKFNFKEANLL